MKTSKEFFEKLKNDEAFAKEIGVKVQEKADAGETDVAAIWVPLAAEYGYEVSSEELNEMVDKAQGELTDEELGKVAGGTTPLVFISVMASYATVTYHVSKALE